MAGTSPPGGDVLAVMRGGGEVGRDLLAVDWAATPLGPPGTWPQSLITVVHVVLTSRFSMWMAWRPELTFFCNDAYRRDTLGTKYPRALGRSAREVWAEIWPDIVPRRDAPTLGRAAALISDALLLVSELVTNAILHGRPPIELRVRRTRSDVLLEVDDGATVLPRKLRPTPEDEHGRGLQLAAMLADRWGTRPLRDGKSVWCLLSLSRY